MVGTRGVVPQSQLGRLAQVGSVSLQSLWATHQMRELRRVAYSFKVSVSPSGTKGRLKLDHLWQGAWHRSTVLQTRAVAVWVFIFLPRYRRVGG